MTRKNMNAAAFKAACAAALFTLPFAANAAECFDEESSNPKAGNATAVVGPDVGLMQSGAADYSRPAAGDDVFSEDYVRTGEASHMQLKLCDWSTYTFPPESEAQISEFYDDDNARRRRLVNYVRGGFRYASGRGSDSGSTEVEIQESGVTMGVRGTNVILVELDGSVYALLEGPMVGNTGYAPQGRVEFWTGENRNAIEERLTRPGWTVRIGPDGISDPFRADAELLERIYMAFLPVVPDDDETGFQYKDKPSDASGQGAQEGKEGVEFALGHNRREDEDTESLPEQPSEAGIPFEQRYEEAFPDDGTLPPFPVAVGEILPLDALDYYAEAQTALSGHILAIAPAQLFIDSGSGPALADDGVVIIQINFDLASGAIAPEALASFVKFDFTTLGLPGLGLSDAGGILDDQFRNAFVQALLASSGIPFSSGEGGLAVFPAQAFTVTVRQGEGETVSVDVTSDFTSTNGQMITSNAVAEALDLQFMPGDGALAYFDFGLSEVFDIAGLEGYSTSGTTRLYGFTSNVVQTLGQAGPLAGLAYAQIEVNFGDRTIGGPGSFIAITATGAEQANAYVPLDQAAPFSAGLFDMALYPLSALTDSGAAVAGQALVASPNGDGIVADIAGILKADTGAHLYSEVLLDSQFFNGAYEPAAIAELDALGASLGTGAFYFDGSYFGYGGAHLSNPATGDFFGSLSAEIDISFGDRTIGGGGSYVSANLYNSSTASTFQFLEFMNAASFNDALGGAGVFALDGADFSGNSVQSLIFIIRNDPAGNAAASADAFMSFTDGHGGKGLGELREMILTPGAACPSGCDN